jgi:hypothetical protein
LGAIATPVLNALHTQLEAWVVALCDGIEEAHSLNKTAIAPAA